MHYFHCTRGMMLESELYLYIHKGSLLTKKQLRKAIDVLKTDAVHVHIAVENDRSVFEKLKTEGFKTIKEAVGRRRRKTLRRKGRRRSRRVR